MAQPKAPPWAGARIPRRPPAHSVRIGPLTLGCSCVEPVENEEATELRGDGPPRGGRHTSARAQRPGQGSQDAPDGSPMGESESMPASVQALKQPTQPQAGQVATQPGFDFSAAGDGPQKLLLIWDGENVPVGRQASPGSFQATMLLDEMVASAGAVPQGGWRTAAEFRKRGGIIKARLVLHQDEKNRWHFGGPEREALIDAGVTIIDPGKKNGAVDTKVKELLRDVALQEDPRTAVLLVGGDRDFASEVRLLRERNFNHLVLLHAGQARASVRELFALQIGDWEARRKRAGLLPMLAQPGMANSSNQGKLCWDFRDGHCSRGDTCRWIHPPKESNGDAPATVDASSPARGSQAASQQSTSVSCESRPRRAAFRQSIYRAAQRVLLPVLTLIVALGLVWLAVEYHRAQQLEGHFEETACRLVSADAEESKVYLGGEHLGFHWLDALPALPWTVAPARSCWVRLEVQGPCGGDKGEGGRGCWRAPDAAADGLSLLTFDYPTKFWSLSQRRNLQCATLAAEYFSLPSADGFPCAFVPNNPTGAGIFAASLEDMSNVLALTVALAGQANTLLVVWLVCAALLATMGAVNRLGALCTRSSRAQAGGGPPAPLSGSSASTGAAAKRRGRRGGRGRGGGQAPGRSSGLPQGLQQEAPVDRRPTPGRWVLSAIFALLVVVIVGGGFLVDTYFSTASMYSHLEDHECCLTSASSWPVTAAASASPGANVTMSSPTWQVLPAITCWASVAVQQQPCAGQGPCVTQALPAGFLHGGSRKARLTFNYPEDLFRIPHHKLQCGTLAEKLLTAHSGCFACTFSPSQPGALGVLVGHKELTSLFFVSLLEASQNRLSFTAWAVALALLLLGIMLWLLSSAATACCGRGIRRSSGVKGEGDAGSAASRGQGSGRGIALARELPARQRGDLHTEMGRDFDYAPLLDESP